MKRARPASLERLGSGNDDANSTKETLHMSLHERAQGPKVPWAKGLWDPGAPGPRVPRGPRGPRSNLYDKTIMCILQI